MWWQRILEHRRRKRETGKPDIAFWRLQSMFNNFRRILELNNATLEAVAEMDRALGGEYIFDRAFLQQSVRRISSHVHHVVYSLNALSGNAHVPLYDRYQDIRIILDDILADDLRALAGMPVLPLREAGWELEPLAGMEAACMAELSNSTSARGTAGSAALHVAEGCVLTTEGTAQLLKRTSALFHHTAAETHVPLHSVHAPAHGLQLSTPSRAAATRKDLTTAIAALLQNETAQGIRVIVNRLAVSPQQSSLSSAMEREPLSASPATTLTVLRIVPNEHDRLIVLVEPPEEQPSPQDTDLPRLDLPGTLPHGTDAHAYITMLEQALRHITTTEHTTHDTGGVPNDTIAVLMYAITPVVVRGSVHSRAACHARATTLFSTTDCSEALRITATDITSAVPGQLPTDRYLLQRTYPHGLLESEIAVHSAGYRFPDGNRATSLTETGRGRGSSLLRQQEMHSLAEAAMTMERMLGLPVVLEWEQNASGACRIVRARPMPAIPNRQASLDDAENDALADAVAEELRAARVLLRGGHLIQSGVVAGKTVHVTETVQAEDIPPGSILIARTASPRLTPLLRHAAALICESGTLAGHLATVARELRLPAVFGLHDAQLTIASGTEITLDAGETTVYKGVLPALLQFSTTGTDLYPTAPEYRMLRRLLRFIAPLHLVNPDADDFAPEGCRTYHDLIHYCHEKAVDELAHFQERRPGLGVIRTKRMQLNRPMDLRVLDIGNGLTDDVVALPGREHVQSGPFADFLDGLLNPDAWDMEPVSLGVRDVMRSVPHSMAMLHGNTAALGENLAIVSGDYVNISLRLGYHFTVVDAYLGPEVHRNHVYFRFAGGLADPDRRHRRARFLRNVLEDMGFKVVLKGDLVVGSLKQEETDTIRRALHLLGTLTAFARQRDTVLRDDADMHALHETFIWRFMRSASVTVAGNATGGNTR